MAENEGARSACDAGARHPGIRRASNLLAGERIHGRIDLFHERRRGLGAVHGFLEGLDRE